ncbi:FixH family protein [Peribacillus loiseleuriae]|uniref:FixH family protein n=1 Tax=Peribacillus loiseleuriae TaxID=1679170 RepID=UPI003D043537
MRKFILLIVCLLILAGCSASDEPKATKAVGLEVNVKSNPKDAKLLEPVKIIATVTNDGVEVSEKAEVMFELIKKDGATLGSINPENIGNGKYQIETIFDEEGVYQIISHVSLENAHEMPIHEINVSP